MLLQKTPLDVQPHDIKTAETFAELIPNDFQFVKIDFDAKRKVLWMNTIHENRPSFSIGLMEEYLRLFGWLASLELQVKSMHDFPIHFLVNASTTPGIFSLGGDLPSFVQFIEEGDRDQLLYYARLCIENLYLCHYSYNLPVINIALLEGDAMGGGLEYALSHDLIIAEKHIKVGFPESRFNLFPGMGAYSLLDRRGFNHLFNSMIRDGKLFNSQDLYEMGLIDSLAEPGKGKDLLNREIDRISSNFGQYINHYKTCRLLNPLPREELRRIADFWVDAAFQLTQADFKKMQALGRAQEKKLKQISNNSYVLPASEEEAQRLSDQAAVFEEATQNLLVKSGIGPGMQCIDIGCGSGDVMRLMGNLVGSSGKVTGVDINEPLGKLAAQKLGTEGGCKYEFVAGDIQKQVSIDSNSQDFTFARFLLLHLKDPIDALRRMWGFTRPGGTLLVMDYDFRSMEANPISETLEELRELIKGVFEKSGLDPHIGSRLPGLFQNAGIGNPDGIEIVAAQKPVYEVAHVLSATLEGFLPAGLKLGIMDNEKADSLRSKVRDLKNERSTFLMFPLVGACWKRK